jgi:peptidase M48-like protein
MVKQVAGAAILIIAFTSTVTGQATKNLGANNNVDAKWEESIGGAEAAKAIARLGDLSPATIHERLRQMRPQAYLASVAHVKKLVESQDLPIASGDGVEKLKKALQPALDYHGRRRMPIYVLRSEQPRAYLIERAVIIVTKRLMVSASAEEIRGIVVHELAHEYVWNERSEALQTKDGKRMRECELFCDAVAAFTLKEIGDDPASYGCVLERLTYIGIKAGNAMRAQSDTHPSLDARKRLNKFLCQLLN